MKQIIICVATLVISANFAYSDSIVSWQVNQITHPVINLKIPKPLIIDYEFTWHTGDVEKYRITCAPMVYKHSYNNNLETIDYQRSFMTYCDAFETPNKKGFIIYKKMTRYEAASPLLEIQVRDVFRWDSYFIEPHGTHFYFLNDPNMLILADIPYVPAGDRLEEVDVTLYYYDLSKRSKTPTKKVTIKMLEMQKYGLIKPLNKR